MHPRAPSAAQLPPLAPALRVQQESALCPDAAEIVRGTLRALLPAVAESLTPPGAGLAESVLGISNDDLRRFALDGLTRRLSIIGVPIDTL